MEPKNPKKKSSVFKEIIELIRPYQWIKNLLLFSPLFFSGEIIGNKLLITSSGVLAFCLVSAIGYIVNDWKDKDKDRFHPKKKNRPLCSGVVSSKAAFITIGILIVLVAILCVISNYPVAFWIYLFFYAGMTIGYSAYLKTIPILEIFIVAVGFVLRVLAGGAVSGIEVSNWLFLTVFFIALMICIAKRVNEYIELGKETASHHRNSQTAYSINYLNNMLWSSSGVTLVVYALYAVEHGSLFVISILPATFGIFRFLYLTNKGRGSDPIKALFSDKQLLLTTLVFLFMLSVMIYS